MDLNSNIAAVVTGGASGLGEAAVRALSARGIRIAIFDVNKQCGEALAAETGGLFCDVDVRSEESVDAGFAAARARHGQERILVNCAGIANGVRAAFRDKASGEVKRFPTAEFERVVQINLIGSFRCLTAAAAGMLALDPLESGERGIIINTASVAAQDGQAGQAAYAASKAGLVGLALPVARDLMNEGVRINTILPGLFETPLMGTLPENIRAALAASVPFPRRLGLPAEYADLALCMIGNAYMNGEAVRLDGAIRLPPR